MPHDDITTDVDLALWLRLQQPAYVEAFARACDEAARERDDVSGLEIFAGVARAVLRGENPVALQRAAAPAVPGYYEEDDEVE